MPPSVADRFNPPVYKVALIGESAAGKTCFLAALGSPGGPRPADGTTCQRVGQLPGRANPPDREVEAATPAAVARDPVLAFHRGRLRLDAAHARMARDEQPRVTQPEEPPLLVAYQFTHPARGRFVVEVAEYSGELLKPVGSPSVEDHKRRLRDLFDACDAVLLVAPVPRRDHPAGSHPELRHLVGAFHDWATQQGAAAQVPKPVALVYTMFDRRVRAGAPPDERAAELSRVVTDLPAHGTLASTARNACRAFEVFAATAYGNHTTRRDATGAVPASDRPLGYPGNTYGLAEPFVWLCDQCDRLEMEDLHRRSAGLRWWAFWQLPGAWGTTALAGRVHARSVSDGPQHRAAAAARRRGLRLAGIHLLLVVLLTGVLGLTAEAAVDSERHRRVELTLADPAATDEQCDRACEWLADYAASPAYRHVLFKWALSRDAASERATRARVELERRVWDGATAVGLSDDARAALLKAYRERYPSGPHGTEVDRRLAEIDDRKAARRHLAELRRDLEGVPPGPAGLPAARQVQARYRGLPPPAGGTPDLAAWEQLGQEVDGAVSSRIADADQRAWFDEKNKVEKALDGRDYLGAAKLLGGSRSKLPEAEEYRRSGFAAAVLDAARRHGERSEREGQITEIERTLAALADARGRPEFERFIDLPALTKLDGHRASAEKSLDKAYYAAFARNPGRQTATEYLDRAPLQVMAAAARAYIEYEAARGRPHQLRATLTVSWGDWPDGYTTDVFLDLRGPRDADWVNQVSERVAAANGSTGGLGSGEFEAAPADRVRVRVNVRREPTNVSKRPWAQVEEGEASYTFEELGSTREFSLGAKEGKDYKVKATVQVHGLPTRPTPPAWKE